MKCNRVQTPATPKPTTAARTQKHKTCEQASSIFTYPFTGNWIPEVSPTLHKEDTVMVSGNTIRIVTELAQTDFSPCPVL